MQTDRNVKSGVMLDASAPCNENRNRAGKHHAEEITGSDRAAGKELLKDFICVMVPDINNPFFCEAIKGIDKLAEEVGFHTVICDTDENAENELRKLRALECEKVGGLIIVPVSSDAHENTQYLHKMQRQGVPVVLMDRDIRLSNLDGVFLDNYKGAFDAVEVLIKAGHRKIGLVTGPATSKTGKDRLDGYIEALRVYNIEKRDEFIHFGDFKWQSGYEITGRILSAEERPTALFVSNNLMSLGCLRALQENNISVPGDMALMVFDDNVYFRINPTLSVVDRSPYQMGVEALNILIEKMNNMKKSSKHADKRIILIPQVILRGSERLVERQ